MIEKGRSGIGLPGGVLVASLTPFGRDLAIDSGLLIQHIDWLFECGANGVVVLGTTGEANSLTIGERKDLISSIAQAGYPLHKIMVGNGSCSVSDTVELSNHALRSGISNLLMLPPFYYKSVTDEGLFRFFDQVIQGIHSGEPNIFLYHFPKMSGVSFSHNLIGKLLENFPEMIRGMKDSSGDLNHMNGILESFPDLQFYSGTEKYLFDIAKKGGAGCISATLNLSIRTAVDAYSNINTPNGDQMQQTVLKLRAAIESFPVIPALKKYLAIHRKNPDWLNIRPPNEPVDDARFKQLLQALDSLHFKI